MQKQFLKYSLIATMLITINGVGVQISAQKHNDNLHQSPRIKFHRDKLEESKSQSFNKNRNAINRHPRFAPLQDNQTERIAEKRIPKLNIDTISPEWVKHYGAGLISIEDNAMAHAITTDAAGNVYVTGASEGSGSSSDYATIKYNQSGKIEWTARYNGTANAYDCANAIAVDEFGNVYVTGESRGYGSSIDFTTIKYNSIGEEQWVARYDGPNEYQDYAFAIAIDVSGNVYVTGQSDGGSSTGDDYATIKYNSSGVQQWAARYDGTGNNNDGAYAIAVDDSANVYVTGFSEGSNGSNDYATIKYNPYGVERWVERYDGKGSGYDCAYALVVDRSGNVYVTGQSYTGSVRYDDYTTIKYNPAGAEEWVRSYDGPANFSDYAKAIAVDSSGNVFVTGESFGNGTSYDYATVKYNSAGDEKWIARFNGKDNEADFATAIAADKFGNVYVTGATEDLTTSYDYATVKYNSDGIEQWVNHYNGENNKYDWANAIAIDLSGNVYVTGRSGGTGTSTDYATVKYNSAGIEDWSMRYEGLAGSDDYAYAIVADTSGNVYVTGTTYSSKTLNDYATIKYNSKGDRLWVAYYNGPNNSDDYAYAIAVDATGNVYVTGESEGAGTSYDFTTVKYNSSGVEQWVRRFNGPSNDYDGAYAMALDPSGNVYVTGISYDSLSHEILTIKYNSTGGNEWVSILTGGTSNSDDYAYAIAVDKTGNVYVTGRSKEPNTSYDIVTIKLNTRGSVQWSKRYNGPGNADDLAIAITVDEMSNVYLTGASVGVGSFSDYITIKYDSSGIEEWAERYNGTGNSTDRATGIALDRFGNVLVTGYSLDSTNFYKYATIKYNSSGVQQWVSHSKGTENTYDIARALSVDASGNVYVTGSSNGSYAEVMTIKYNTEGAEQWTSRYSMAGNSNDYAYAIALDRLGNVYVTGNSSYLKQSFFTTIKYSRGTVSVDENNPTSPTSFELNQNYPNPFNPSTTIRFDIPHSSFVTLKVYNILGQEVVTLVSEKRDVGKYEVYFDGSKFSSGVYFYRLQTTNYSKTMKLLLLK